MAVSPVSAIDTAYSGGGMQLIPYRRNSMRGRTVREGGISCF